MYDRSKILSLQWAMEVKVMDAIVNKSHLSFAIQINGNNLIPFFFGFQCVGFVYVVHFIWYSGNEITLVKRPVQAFFLRPFFMRIKIS